MTGLATSLLLLGLPGLMFVRSAAPWARLLALLAAVAIAAAIWVPPASAVASVPVRVAVVGTAPDGAAPAALTAELARGAATYAGMVRVGGAGLPTAVAAAFAKAGPGDDAVVIVWDGPLDGATAVHARLGSAWTTVPPLPWSPSDLRLRLERPPQLGRPVMVSLAMPEAPAPLRAAVAVRSGDRRVFVAEEDVSPGRAVEWTWQPDAAGEHTVDVTVRVGAHTVSRSGRFTVAAPASVLVVDPSGVAAAALRAQGMAVAEAADLPAAFTGIDAIVLGCTLPPASQLRLAEAVDAGLGLLALAPAFAPAGEPLFALLPIRPLPRPEAGDARGGGAEGPPAAQPDPSPTPADPKAAEPPAPPTDRPPTGDTSQATPDPAGPTEVDKHAVAMVLVVDRSGSMEDRLPSGATKMSYAVTSALATARELAPGDALGVVTFGNKDQGRVELPLTPIGDDRIGPAIRRLAAFPEQTFLLSGLRRAAAELRASKASVKHIVVISDGAFYGEHVALCAEAERLRREDKITLGIISFIATGTDTLFKQRADELARIGGGLFTPSEDPTKVPIHVSAEVVRALDRVGRRPRTEADGPGTGPGTAPRKPDDPTPPPPSPPEEPKPEPKPPAPAPKAPETPKATRLAVRAVANSPLLAPLPATAWPALGAAVPCTAPLDAHVLLVVGEEGSPLLAFGNRGLGRVAALAADVGASAAAEFTREPAFPARLAQWVAAVLPPQPQRQASMPLAEVRIAPPAPTPEQAAALGALAGAPLRPLAGFTAPPPRPMLVRRSQVADWAIAGFAALLVLALAEWWSARRVPRA